MNTVGEIKANVCAVFYLLPSSLENLANLKLEFPNLEKKFLIYSHRSQVLIWIWIKTISQASVLWQKNTIPFLQLLQ